MVGMMVASVLIPAILLVGSLVWIAFYASGYSLFQKIVIAVIAMIVICTPNRCSGWSWAGKKGMGYWMPAQANSRTFNRHLPHLRVVCPASAFSPKAAAMASLFFTIMTRSRMRFSRVLDIIR